VIRLGVRRLLSARRCPPRAGSLVLARAETRRCCRCTSSTPRTWRAAGQAVRGEEGAARPQQPRLLAHAAAPRDGRLVRPFVDATLTNTDAGKESLIATDRLRPERVVVLENGVDTNRFSGSCCRTRRRRRCASGASPPAPREERGRPDARPRRSRSRSSRNWCSKWPATASSARSWSACTRNSASASDSSFAGRSRTCRTSCAPWTWPFFLTFRRDVERAVGVHGGRARGCDRDRRGRERPSCSTAASAGCSCRRTTVSRWWRRSARCWRTRSARRGTVPRPRTRVDAEFSRTAMRKRFESFYKELVSA